MGLRTTGRWVIVGLSPEALLFCLLPSAFPQTRVPDDVLARARVVVQGYADKAAVLRHGSGLGTGDYNRKVYCSFIDPLSNCGR